MKNVINSDGFSVLHVLLVLIIVGIVGGTGWYVWDTNQKASQNYNAQDSSAAGGQSRKATELPKVYKDSLGRFSVNYPSNWKVSVTKDLDDESSAFQEAKVTSPTGTVLTLKSDWGGKGGMCEPDANDAPFAAGNSCNSKEYLSVEKLNVDSVYYAHDEKSADGMVNYVYKKTDIMLVTSRFADGSGKTQYSVGLKDSNAKETISVNQPTMGAVGPEHFFGVYDSAGKFHPYIYATATSDNKEFLKSKDAETVKAILRTLKVDR